MAEKNKELVQIVEIERVQPLLERIEKLFKKTLCDSDCYCYRCLSCNLGTVVGSISTALKATNKDLGNGLKDVGASFISCFKLFGCILVFSAECTIGMVWGLTALKHYGNKALCQ